MENNYLKIGVVAGCLIEKDGKFLLVQEKKPQAYKLWNLPAGRVEEGCTIAETAVKEAKEETGYDVEIIREIAVLHKEGGRNVGHYFEAKIVGGNIKINKEEILDVQWFSSEEIVDMNEHNKLRTDRVVTLLAIWKKSLTNQTLTRPEMNSKFS